MNIIKNLILYIKYQVLNRAELNNYKPRPDLSNIELNFESNYFGVKASETMGV